MSAPASLVVAGRNLYTEFGLVLRRPQPWAGMAVVERPTTGLPGRVGVLPSAYGTSVARVYTLGIYKKPTTLAALVELRDQLADFLHGMVPIVWPDAPDRFAKGECTKLLPGAATANALTATDADLDVEFTCYDAAKYDLEARCVALSTTRAPIELGTLASVGEIWIKGVLTTATTITVRGPSGIPLAFVTLTPTLSNTNDFARINFDQPATITKITSAGAITDAYTFKTAGRWFRLDSADSDRDGTARCTVELSQGTGALYYHRAWRS